MDKKRTKILMIDPWGISNLTYYTGGLCRAIAPYIDLTLITNYYSPIEAEGQYKVNKIFFEKSEAMKRGLLRICFRGFEYCHACHKILSILQGGDFDIVHIQWLLSYKIDLRYIKKFRRYCSKIVYTAHNVLPHIEGEKYLKDMSKIYDNVDSVIVHGENIAKEFQHIFPEYASKLYIQHLGIFNQSIEYDDKIIEQDITNKVQKYHDKKIYLFLGNMFYNKGTDRLIKIWIEKFSNSDSLLIVAGEKDSSYKEMDSLESRIKETENIIYISQRISDNLLNFFMHHSDIVLLPYRHASMSGVVATASKFGKTVLCTDVGALSEYIQNDVSGFIVENGSKAIADRLAYIDKYIGKKVLFEMGQHLLNDMSHKFNWDVIGKELIHSVYNFKRRK